MPSKSLRHFFRNRLDAGAKLAEEVAKRNFHDPYVLAIPRGGVPVGFGVALKVRAPLDVIIPRKLPIPDNPEAGFGAITSDGNIVLNEEMLPNLALSEEEVERIAKRVLEEVRRRMCEYRGERPEPNLEGKTVLLVDDGLASGYTMIAAAQEVKAQRPARVVVAVPVSPRSSVEKVSPHVDEVIALIVSERPCFAVADFYDDFRDLSDDEVRNFLEISKKN